MDGSKTLGVNIVIVKEKLCANEKENMQANSIQIRISVNICQILIILIDLVYHEQFNLQAKPYLLEMLFDFNENVIFENVDMTNKKAFRFLYRDTLNKKERTKIVWFKSSSFCF